MGISHIGVQTEHVEPEDRRPGALLLAGVGDDDHRDGGGLERKTKLKSHFPFSIRQ